MKKIPKKVMYVTTQLYVPGLNLAGHFPTTTSNCWNCGGKVVTPLRFVYAVEVDPGPRETRELDACMAVPGFAKARTQPYKSFKDDGYVPA